MMDQDMPQAQVPNQGMIGAATGLPQLQYQGTMPNSGQEGGHFIQEVQKQPVDEKKLEKADFWE